jgi:hypothetical protein
MDFSHWLLLFCTLLGFYNVAVTWLAQLVMYPLFAKVGAEDYVTYHTFYLHQIPRPVIVPGFANFLLPIALIFCRPPSVSLPIALANAACGLLSLVVTVALEIPRHDRLEKGGKQETVIRELIRYNWPRTFGIMGSAVLTLLMLIQAFSPI